MTVVNPDSIAGITSVTSSGTTLEFYDVNGNLLDVSANLTGELTVGTGATISSPGANAIDFETNGSEKLRITSGGNVNIGGNYTQSNAPLSVTTSANAYGMRLMTGSNVVTEILNNDAAGNSEIRGYYNNNTGSRGEGYRLEANGETFFNPGGNTGLNIKSDGKVGINESSPTGKLTITQAPQGFPADSAQPKATLLIKHGTSGSNRRWVGIGASLTGAWIQSSSPGGTGLAAPFSINPGGGFVGINQTNPAVELDIKAGSPEIRLTCSDANLDQGDTIGQIGWYTTDPTTPGGAGTVSYINTFSANGNGADYSTKIFNRDGSGGGSTQIQLGNAVGSIIFGTNTTGNAATTRLTINSSGQMGLGMSPGRMFEVKDSTNANRIMNIRGTGTSGAFLAFLDANTTDDSKCRIGSIGGNSIGMRGDAHHFQNGAGTNRMVIDSNGDVLINQPAEASGRLTIKGTNSNGSTAWAVSDSGKAREGMDITCTTCGDGNFGGAISFGCGGNGRSAIAARQYGSDDDVNGLSFFAHNSNNGADNTVERLRIKGNGIMAFGSPSDMPGDTDDDNFQWTFARNVGSNNGRTWPNSNNRDLDFSHALQVHTPVKDGTNCPAIVISETGGQLSGRNGLYFWNGDSGSGAGYIKSRIYTQVGSSYQSTQFYIDVADSSKNHQQRFRIDTSGNFHGSSSNNISDQRLKKDIATITDPLTKIKGLTGRTFKWKEDSTKFDDKTKFGFVAQEVETILPELVNSDGLMHFDADDKICDEFEAVSHSKSVLETGVIPITVEALKILITKIETLESKVESIQTQQANDASYEAKIDKIIDYFKL